MAFGKDVAGSARRHFKAAVDLCATTEAGAKRGNLAVAGYLFGLSGELAVKEIMRDSGMTPLPAEQRRDDPFYHHFPTLKTLLLDGAKGRRARELRKLAEQAQLFQYWDTEMRYAPTADIKDEWITAWRESAKQLIEQMTV